MYRNKMEKKKSRFSAICCNPVSILSRQNSTVSVCSTNKATLIYFEFSHLVRCNGVLNSWYIYDFTLRSMRLTVAQWIDLPFPVIGRS